MTSGNQPSKSLGMACWGEASTAQRFQGRSEFGQGESEKGSSVIAGNLRGEERREAEGQEQILKQVDCIRDLLLYENIIPNTAAYSNKHSSSHSFCSSGTQQGSAGSFCHKVSHKAGAAVSAEAHLQQDALPSSWDAHWENSVCTEALSASPSVALFRS